MEIGGPEAIRLTELAREFMSAREDPRRIIADAHALYYGTELDDHSLIPGPGARLGANTFGNWLRQSITAD